MRLAEHFISFHIEFNKLNKTGARILDYIYHMTLKLLKHRILGMKTSRFGTFMQY